MKKSYISPKIDRVLIKPKDILLVSVDKRTTNYGQDDVTIDFEA